MNLYYNCNLTGDHSVVADKNPRPVDADTPSFRNISFSHISAVDVKIAAGFFYGLAEMPLTDITLRDISISMAANAQVGFAEMADGIPQLSQAGFFIRNARNIRFDNVQIRGQLGQAFDLDESVEANIVS
jgi:hypothetical protein